MMTTEDEIQLKKNQKKLLENIRKEKESHEREHANSSTGHAEARAASSREDEGSVQGSIERTQGGTQGAGAIDNTSQGLDSGIRQTNEPGINTYQGIDSGDRGQQARVVTPEEIEAEEARQRELGRQRTQRHRDKKQAEKAQIQAENVTSRNVTEKKPVTSKKTFDFKNPLNTLYGDEKVKLFTKSEAEEELPKLTDLYEKFSQLPDEILEIIVKDHEPVQIWAMSTEEASIFAEAKLRRAQTNEQDAREARKLLDIYDRIYFFLWMYPRLQATGRHVIEHKGFSFK